MLAPEEQGVRLTEEKATKSSTADTGGVGRAPCGTWGEGRPDCADVQLLPRVEFKKTINKVASEM